LRNPESAEAELASEKVSHWYAEQFTSAPGTPPSASHPSANVHRAPAASQYPALHVMGRFVWYSRRLLEASYPGYVVYTSVASSGTSMSTSHWRRWHTGAASNEHSVLHMVVPSRAADGRKLSAR